MDLVVTVNYNSVNNITSYYTAVWRWYGGGDGKL